MTGAHQQLAHTVGPNSKRNEFERVVLFICICSEMKSISKMFFICYAAPCNCNQQPCLHLLRKINSKTSFVCLCCVENNCSLSAMPLGRTVVSIIGSPRSLILPAGHPDEIVYVPWVPKIAHQYLTPGHPLGRPHPHRDGHRANLFMFMCFLEDPNLLKLRTLGSSCPFS